MTTNQTKAILLTDTIHHAMHGERNVSLSDGDYEWLINLLVHARNALPHTDDPAEIIELATGDLGGDFE